MSPELTAVLERTTLLFVIALAFGYVADLFLRLWTNQDTIRVTYWCSRAVFQQIKATGFVPAYRSGWGPLTGFGPHLWTVWTSIEQRKNPWALLVKRFKSASKVNPYGVTFDILPGERHHRAYSKALGAAVRIQSSEQGIDLADRNPQFIGDTESDQTPDPPRVHFPDVPWVSGLALFGFCFGFAATPLLTSALLLVAAVGYGASEWIV